MRQALDRLHGWWLVSRLSAVVLDLDVRVRQHGLADALGDPCTSTARGGCRNPVLLILLCLGISEDFGHHLLVLFLLRQWQVLDVDLLCSVVLARPRGHGAAGREGLRR